ncbi:MAG: nuclear transport factor 2 family protein [Acidimicrobiia bacterium]
MTGATAMPSNEARAAALVRSIEASIVGDSSVVAELYTDDVDGVSHAVHVTSAVELAVELEDRDDAFSDVELVVNPLDVGGTSACVEWSATATHSGPLPIDDDTAIGATGQRVTLEGVTVAEFDGDRIRRFRQYGNERDVIASLARDVSPNRRQ